MPSAHDIRTITLVVNGAGASARCQRQGIMLILMIAALMIAAVLSVAVAVEQKDRRRSAEFDNLRQFYCHQVQAQP